MEIRDEGMEFDDCNEGMEAKDQENLIDIVDKESSEIRKVTEDKYIERERKAKRREGSGEYKEGEERTRRRKRRNKY
jgi:hypothetical protein